MIINVTKQIFILVVLFALTDCRKRRPLGVKNKCGELHIEILVSPLVGKGVLRQLELQWEYAPARPGDKIAIFATDPIGYRNSHPARELPPQLDSVLVTEVHGWLNTSLFEQHQEPDLLGYSPQCLNYYAAYLTADNQTLTATCLRTEPTWMWDLKPEMGPRRLSQVFLPGTHDSAAYGEYDEEIGDGRVKKYSITQDERILGQLIYGARYIDLRVGYYQANREPWWGNHGLIKIHPLYIILRDIATFLDNTQEIVILDVQEFPVGFGDTKEVHKLLVNYIERELGRYIVSPSLGWEATLDQVWATGRRLIIGYDDQEMVQQSNILWPPVRQMWGDVRTLDDLYSYLSGVINGPPSSSWSAMAELTPDTLDVILDRLKGLRVMAESVNHDVTAWFRRPEWDEKTNVVSVDFIRGTGVVRAAIEWNKFQGQCRHFRL